VADQEPKKRGRKTPPEDGYSEEIHQAVIERLMQGRSLLSICRDKDIPSHATVLRWRKKYPDFDEAIPRAREEGTHVLADQCLEIADNSDLDPQDRRVRIDTRLRLIGKWNARNYGEKQQVEHTGGVNITVVDGYSDTV
jgi:hypothetical protein